MTDAGNGPRCSVGDVHFVIMGCGRVGATLARSLSERGYDVAVIDMDPTSFRRLGTGFEGRTVTGFANVEEDFADDAVRRLGLLPADGHVMPWRIEDRLRALGANYVQAGLWRGFAVRDGNLVTGQQNFSGAETARAVIAALGG